MRASPFAPLHVDLVFRNICGYLNIKEYGRLMRVNRLFWETFITDAAWAPFYERLVNAMPLLKEHVFGAYPWKLSGERGKERDVKRAKFGANNGVTKATKPLIMPRGGIYYVMRHFMVPMCSISGIKRLCSLSTSSHFRQSQDPCHWTTRDRTVWHLFSIVFPFVFPPALGVTCANCIVKRHANRWLHVDLRLNDGSITYIDLFHCNMTAFSMDAPVQTTNELWILERYRCVVYSTHSFRNTESNFRAMFPH